MVVEELWRELKDSQFQPAGFEVNFGGEGGFSPIAIPNRAMNALLRGFVDRVDIWISRGGTYYRVVDYKTGKKDFDYCDVFNGVGLQMLLYLFALREDGEELLGERPFPQASSIFRRERRIFLLTEGWSRRSLRRNGTENGSAEDCC